MKRLSILTAAGIGATAAIPSHAASVDVTWTPVRNLTPSGQNCCGHRISVVRTTYDGAKSRISPTKTWKIT